MSEIKTSWDIACQDVIIYEDDEGYVINPDIPNNKWIPVESEIEFLNDCIEILQAQKINWVCGDYVVDWDTVKRLLTNRKEQLEGEE